MFGMYIVCADRAQYLYIHTYIMKQTGLLVHMYRVQHTQTISQYINLKCIESLFTFDNRTKPIKV